MESLLLNFRVENFRSIRDEQELNLTRANRDQVEGFANPDVVPAVAIFGANAAGKSNLLRALNTMFRMIRSSANQVEGDLPYTPFALDGSEGRPTVFVVNVRFDGVRHEYGFSYTRERVLSEWLKVWPRGRQRVLFERDLDAEDEWYFGDSLSGANQTLARATRPDALFLSTARVLSHEQLGPLHERFANLVRGLNAENFQAMLQGTLRSLNESTGRQRAVAGLLSQADLGVIGMHIDEESPDPEVRRILEVLSAELSPENRAQLERTQLGARLDHSGVFGSVTFPWGWESTGTKNFLILLGPVLERLASGGVLVIDEIDASLHPRLVSELVRMFQKPESNDRQAQVILSTHDVTVMMNVGDYDVLQRDQIWFVDKDAHGASVLTPLMTYKPRKGEVFSRNYLNDRYGGVPSIDSEAFFVRPEPDGEDER